MIDNGQPGYSKQIEAYHEHRPEDHRYNFSSNGELPADYDR